VPTALAELLALQFPGYRLPRLDDLSAEFVKLDRESGGTGCFAVALGDYDGDGQEDIALYLPSNRGTAPLLLVGLRRSETWAFFMLPTWCGKTIEQCYVETTKPGTFTRTEALDGPLERDERQSIHTTTQSITAGTLEATGVVYSYLDRKWVHVWVSD